MKTTLMLAALALTVAACASEASVDDDGVEETASADTKALPAKTTDRVVIARMYVEGKRSIAAVDAPGLSAEDYANRIADDLARLKPTYVSGLLRNNRPLAAGASALTADEVTAFKAVRKRLPGAKLDVALTTETPAGKLTKDQLLAQMESIDDAIHPDGWFFDFFTSGDPQVIAAAIAWAHSPKRNEFVGGNYFSSPSSPNGTDKADYFSVPDNECGGLDTGKVDSLRAKFGKPVLVHINNNAQNDATNTCSGKTGTLSCTYINDWSHSRRGAYLDKRASGQKAGHYTYMYNAFFPACPIGQYYDAAKDKAPSSNKTMLDQMVEAADEFN